MADEKRSAEDEAAERFRAYHERTRNLPGLRERRQALADFAKRFYRERLHVRENPGSLLAMDRLADGDSIAIEMAHDGQLPHLGIVRLVLKAHDIARRDGRGVTLYLVGNHYTASMRPDNIHFGMPLKGLPPDSVKHPPKLRIGKENAHKPFRWLPPPAQEELLRLRQQVSDFIANNVGAERGLATSERERVLTTLDERLTVIFEVLDRAAAEVESLGDWLVRVQHDLFHRMLAADADQILFLPMADLTELFRDELSQIARNSAAVAAIKASVSAEQMAHGEDPYEKQAEPSAFWVYCSRCLRRQRTSWSRGDNVPFVCKVCGHQEMVAWQRLMPDIVAYEVGLFRLGIDGWVVGSAAPYHPVIERVYASLFREEMPPKVHLRSVPTFRGIGDAPGGYRKTRLLRALLEIEPPALARALAAPWEDDPVITSDFLA